MGVILVPFGGVWQEFGLHTPVKARIVVPVVTCCCDELKSSKRKHAVVAQLVEHHLAKVDVASSSLVNRSTESPEVCLGAFSLSPKVLCLGE